MPSGSGPENRFLLKLIALKLYKLSIPFGISPSNKLSDKSSDLSPFKDQMPEGNGPENWLEEKSIAASVEHEPTLSGIFPENLFLAKEIACKDPHCLKKSSGMVPDRLFSLKSINLRFWRRARLGPMLPVILFFASDNFRRNCNWSRPLPIFPEREKPSRTRSVTRLDLGLHLTPTQLQGLSSSSFQDANFEFGSWISALNTIKPRTSSFRDGFRDSTQLGATTSKANNTPSRYAISEKIKSYKLCIVGDNHTKLKELKHSWSSIREYRTQRSLNYGFSTLSFSACQLQAEQDELLTVRLYEKLEECLIFQRDFKGTVRTKTQP